MPDVQARAARIRKHVEDVELFGQLRGGHLARNFMAHGERMTRGNFFSRIEGAESLLLIPGLLPLGFDQMKRILSATACHRAEDTTQTKGRLNRGIIVCSQLFASFRFNTTVQSANDHSVRPHWLRVLIIGRRPKATLARIVVLVATCFVTFKFILLPIRIEGVSMLPTYHDRQINCVNRLAYLRHEPQRGEIVSVRLSDPGGIANPSIMF